MNSIAITTLLFTVIAATSLVVFLLFAFITYYNNREKVFKFYGLYCLFVVLYIVLHRLGFLSDAAWRLSVHWASFCWLLQIVYLNFYLLFGAYFLDLNERYFRTVSFLRTFMQASVGLALFAFGLEYVPAFYGVSLVTPFYLYVFVPLVLCIAIYIIALAIRSNHKSKYYFLVGSVVYIVLSVVALVLSSKRILTQPLPPIALFYIAVILECGIFSYALGQRIRNTYRQKLRIQAELNKSKALLQEKLETEVAKQQEHIYLLEELQGKQRLETEVAVLQNKVLHSQMNSHFIFNVLNSIKSYIINNDPRNAVFYLNNFAQFIRKILDGSIYEQSNLEDELQAIELYVSIEKMRFDEPLTYDIIIGDLIDLKAYSFPALLLQPFVENAIWHGLLPKKSDRKLLITVASPDVSICRITIEDNGIGREQSRLGNAKRHAEKSHGLTIVDNRIAVYNRENAQQISYKITDLPVGTRAEVEISGTHVPAG